MNSHEDLNWKSINDAFHVLMSADALFLKHYGDELERIGSELNEIGSLLNGGPIEEAWEKYNVLRTSLFTSRKALSGEIAKMHEAQTHVHQLLT